MGNHLQEELRKKWKRERMLAEKYKEERKRNNSNNERMGSFTGRCGWCGSKNLWDDNHWCGCNECDWTYGMK